MKKTTFFLVSLTAFCFSVIALTPASLVYTAFHDRIITELPDLSLKKIEGTIWNGKSKIKFRQFPIVDAAWQLNPLSLVTLTVKSTVTVTAVGLQGKFEMSVNRDGITIKILNAIIEDQYLNEITVPYGLDLSGDINLSATHLYFDKQWLTKAEGELIWGGGIVHIQNPERIYTANLPALKGHLSLVDNICIVDVKESDKTMMQIYIKPDGWAKVAINYALIDLINIPLPIAAIANEDPAIVLEEKIL